MREADEKAEKATERQALKAKKEAAKTQREAAHNRQRTQYKSFHLKLGESIDEHQIT